MNLFTYIWMFIAVILIMQGIRTSTKGNINKKPFIFATLAIVFVLLNVFLQ